MDVVTGDFDANQDKPVNEKPVSIFLKITIFPERIQETEFSPYWVLYSIGWTIYVI